MPGECPALLCLDALVEMGRADANRWATLNGFGGQGACDLSGECEAVF